MRCLLTYQSRHWGPGSPSIPQSLPIRSPPGRHTLLAHYPELSSPVTGLATPPSSFGLYITCCFISSVCLLAGLLTQGALFGQWLLSYSPSCLLTWPGSVWTLPDVSISTCFLSYIYNKNLNPLGESVMSSFYFFFSFSSQIMLSIPSCFLVHCLC